MGVPNTLPKMSPQPHMRLTFEGFQYAKEHGMGNVYNHRVLAAFFVEGRGIVQIDVLTELAAEVGLNRREFEQSLRTRRHREAHRRALRRACEEAGVTGVPMFVIGDRELPGLQKRDTLEKVIAVELAASTGERRNDFQQSVSPD
jgi:predicted DsbA family dithiol-disulfide isomerase